MNTVLVSDVSGQRLLLGDLGLPVAESCLLPDIPQELHHVRDVVKLHALAMTAPAIHVDFDVFLETPLPERVLSAATCGEFWYPTRPFLRLLHEDMTVKRFEHCPIRSVAHGIFGGNDRERLVAYCHRSLACALHPANREAFQRSNGYQGSVYVGEAAFSHEFPDTEMLFPGSRDYSDYRAAGYVHLAGHKADPAKLSAAATRVALAFPKEFAALCERWAHIQRESP